jgi:asparagine synthetase B (glutamine-hydrolysing)
MTGYIAAPATIYRDVAKLSPGHWMRCGANGSIVSHRYFDPNEIAAHQSATAADVRCPRRLLSFRRDRQQCHRRRDESRRRRSARADVLNWL